jgi:CRP-like cAMP-binding protein
MSIPANRKVLGMGEVGDAVFIILEGTVRIFTGSEEGCVILSIAREGEVLGEINAADAQGYSAHAVTLEPCIFLRFGRHEFMQLAHDMPQLSHNLIHLLARRLRLCTMRIHALATGDTKGRLARLLLAFAGEFGVAESGAVCDARSGDEPVTIPVRLTQEDLSGMIGATRPHVNKVLSIFRESGLVSVDAGHRITIHNKAALLKHCT